MGFNRTKNALSQHKTGSREISKKEQTSKQRARDYYIRSSSSKRYMGRNNKTLWKASDIWIERIERQIKMHTPEKNHTNPFLTRASNVVTKWIT